MLIEQIQSRISYYRNRINELRTISRNALELANGFRGIIPKLANTRNEFEKTVNENCSRIAGLAELGISSKLINDYQEVLRGEKYNQALDALDIVSNEARRKAEQKETEASDAQREERRTNDLLINAKNELAAETQRAAAALQDAAAAAAAAMKG